MFISINEYDSVSDTESEKRQVGDIVASGYAQKGNMGIALKEKVIPTNNYSQEQLDNNIIYYPNPIITNPNPHPPVEGCIPTAVIISNDVGYIKSLKDLTVVFIKHSPLTDVEKIMINTQLENANLFDLCIKELNLKLETKFETKQQELFDLIRHNLNKHWVRVNPNYINNSSLAYKIYMIEGHDFNL